MHAGVCPSGIRLLLPAHDEAVKRQRAVVAILREIGEVGRPLGLGSRIQESEIAVPGMATWRVHFPLGPSFMNPVEYGCGVVRRGENGAVISIGDFPSGSEVRVVDSKDAGCAAMNKSAIRQRVPRHVAVP